VKSYIDLLLKMLDMHMILDSSWGLEFKYACFHVFQMMRTVNFLTLSPHSLKLIPI